MQPDLKSWLSRKPKGKAPKKPLPKVSKRGAIRKRQYNAMLPGWKARHPVCEVCPIIQAGGFKIRCLGKTDHPHHVRGRLGPLLTDERYLLACCGGESHPQWIHFTNKAAAIRLGLIIEN